MMKQDQFNRWKRKLSTKLTRVLLITGAPLVVYSVFSGPDNDSLVAIGVYGLLLLLSFARNISPLLKSSLVVAAPMVVGIFVLVNYGVVGGARLYIGLSIILALVLFGHKVGNWLFAFSVGFLLIVGKLSLAGLIQHDASAYPLSQDGYWWIWFIGTFVLCVAVGQYSVSYLHKRLEHNFMELETSVESKELTIREEQKSKELYQLLADNVTDIIWTMNLDLELTYVSPSVFAVRGYTPDEVIQMGVTGSVVALEDAEMQEMLRLELAKDAPVAGAQQTVRIETQLSHKNGRWVEVELVLSFLRDHDGEVTGILGVSREMGDRKRLELAMDTVLSGIKQKQGNEFFDALTSKLQEALGMQIVFVGKVNKDNFISTMSVSKGGVKGDNFEYDLVGTPCQIVGEDGVCSYPSNIQNLFPNDHLLVDMGMESYIGVSVRDDAGIPIGIMVAMDSENIKDVQLGERLFDIFSSHVRAEILRQEEEVDKSFIQQQLVQAQKMESIGQLSGGIAHDFNNLLVVINGYVELAKEHQHEDKELDEYLTEIEKAAHRATGLTRQLLSFSRRQIMELKPLNLNELISGLSGLLTRLLPENIDYQFIPVSDLGTINADPGQLEQAIVNLAVNARDAMPEGGRLTIETENILIDQNYVDTHPWTKLGRYVLLRISDTGTGISPEMQGRIFEPFFTTKAEGQGTGLGLSVFFGIVKQHGGFTHLYSELGKGSEFRTYLPIVERNASSLERKLEPKLTRGSGLILLVEDEEQVSRLAMTILRRAGYEVVVAKEGERAVEEFRKHHNALSLVLLDVVLPKLDGRGVMKEIQSIDPDVPILFTSGYSSNGIHTNFILEDNLILLQKPYSAESLLRKVLSTIEDHKASKL